MCSHLKCSRCDANPCHLWQPSALTEEPSHPSVCFTGMPMKPCAATHSAVPHCARPSVPAWLDALIGCTAGCQSTDWLFPHNIWMRLHMTTSLKKKNLNKYLLYIMLSITQFHVDLWCSVTVSRGDSLTAQMSAKAEYEQESMIYLNATFQYFFVKYVKLEVFRVIRLVYCRKRRSHWGLGSLHAGKYHTGICILPWGRWCCNGSLRSATSLRRDRVPEASSVTDPYSLGPVYVCVYLIHAVITVKKVISYPETKVNFSYRVMKSKSQ